LIVSVSISSSSTSRMGNCEPLAAIIPHRKLYLDRAFPAASLLKSFP
jgi:hypothetical protein